MIVHYSPKIEKIFQLATQQVGTSWRLARQKIVFALIISIIETGSVQFPELVTKLNNAAQDESNLRRIQSFFANYQFDYRMIACVLMSFVTTQKCRISLDRTNWQFGNQNINILTLTVLSIVLALVCSLCSQCSIKKATAQAASSNAQERIDFDQVCAFIRQRTDFVAHRGSGVYGSQLT